MRPPGFLEVRSSGDDEFRKSNGNGNANVSSTRLRDSSSSDEGGASLIDKPTHSSELQLSPAPVCRKFWKAGNYEIGLTQDCKASNLNTKWGHICHHKQGLKFPRWESRFANSKQW